MGYMFQQMGDITSMAPEFADMYAQAIAKRLEGAMTFPELAEKMANDPDFNPFIESGERDG